MDQMEKPRYSPYDPILEDESSQSSENDELLRNETPSPPWAWKRRIYSLRSRLLITLGITLLVILYSVILIILVSMWWKNEMLHGAAVVDSRFSPCDTV